jgi:MATE family multidrug resistance protein
LESDAHPFTRHPHRTFLRLSVAVLISLIAEPLTGLVDTHFVSRLGSSVPLAALGVATTVLSALFWLFGFLGAGTQTETARAHGANDNTKLAEDASGAIVLASVLGVVGGLAFWPCLPSIVSWMGADGDVASVAQEYMAIRLLSAPAVLLIFATFGVFRGLQDMRTPLWIALTINACNVVLDPLLIFGLGPIPGLAVAGAAWASVISQWIGAIWAVIVVSRRVGFRRAASWSAARRLLVIGRDLIVRVGCLNLFLVLTTRAATQIGVEAGAAHQAVRQAWFFSALFLDAFATTAHSLVAYFIGSTSLGKARQVALLSLIWSVGAGVALAVAMLLLERTAAGLLVPEDAVAIFGSAWLICAVSQPLCGASFATDGIHWGASDFAYLRNVVLLATGVGVALLLMVDPAQPRALEIVWAINVLWIAVRAILGVLRVWPGFGHSPLSIRPASPANSSGQRGDSVVR